MHHAHRRRNALDRAVSHIAHGEYAGHARLKEQRCAIEPRGAALRDVRSGQDETPLVFLDFRRDPSRVRLGADQDKKRLCIDRGFSFGYDIPQHQVVEPAAAGTTIFTVCEG